MNAHKSNRLSFLAIDPYIDTHIVKPIEDEVRGKEWITWGKANNYPLYLDSLYDNTPTLKSIIDGLTDYICGNSVTSTISRWNVTVNDKGETLENLIHHIAHDYSRYGGFAINIVKNRMGDIAGLYYIDFAKCRANRDRTIIYYANDWTKSYGRVKPCEYFNFTTDEGRKAKSSIYWYSNSYKQVYPTPIYGSAVIPCEIEKNLNEMNINLVNNTMSSNFILNFNNGVPNDEQKYEIERDVYEKFTGYENAGRPILSFQDDKEHGLTVEKIDQDNWADKYTNLQKTSREQIFTAFRATPILFGVDMQNTGFNQQEYASAFALFNHTVVKPIQKKICDVFDNIFEQKDSIVIEPYKIIFDKTEEIQ